MRRSILLLAFAAAGLSAPSSALADGGLTLPPGSSQITYTSDINTAANLFITRQSGTVQCGAALAAGCIQFADSLPVRVGMTGCTQLTTDVAACSLAAFSSIRLTLRDGDDFAVVLGNVDPTTMDGGEDDDSLRSDTGSDTMLGGEGADELDDAGDDGAGGNDTIDGGPGPDEVLLGSGDDVVNGGTGVDTAELGSGDDTVRLDDLANDGETGEAKNLRSDLEIVDGGGGGDTLFGNGGANTLRGGLGNDLIDGGAGDDSIDGGGGADDLAGGDGVDTLGYTGTAAQRVTLDGVRDDGATGELDNARADIENVAAGLGDDELIGSGSDNALDGGGGNDRIDGAGGVDTFLGGAGADTLLARDGVRETVNCGADADGGEGDTIDDLVDCENVALSDERIADADGDGATKPADCDDRNPAIRPGVVDVPENGIDEDCSGADAENLDRDGDGFLRPTDCNDANRLINPGARDIPGNRVDEDCSGSAAPFPLLGSLATGIFDFPGRFTRVVSINIRRPRKGSTLRITCRGRGCPFRTRTRRITRNRTKQIINKPLGGARLRKGTRLEVRITKRNTIGFFVRFTMRPGRFPARTERCLPPGAKRPSRCP